MLSSSAKGGENVPARGLKDQDFEVEGEVGKLILQSGEFGPNQINFYSTSTQRVLHRGPRIITCRGEASTSTPVVFKLGFLQSWSSHKDPRVKRAVVGAIVLSAKTALLLSASWIMVCFNSFNTSIEHLLRCAWCCSKRGDVIVIKIEWPWPHGACSVCKVLCGLLGGVRDEILLLKPWVGIQLAHFKDE